MCLCCPFSRRNHGENFLCENLTLNFFYHTHGAHSKPFAPFYKRKERMGERERDRKKPDKQSTILFLWSIISLQWTSSNAYKRKTAESKNTHSHSLSFSFSYDLGWEGECVCVLFVVAKFCAIGYNFQWESVLCILCARNSTWYINMVLVVFFFSLCCYCCWCALQDFRF